jgi:hypothetical protein
MLAACGARGWTPADPNALQSLPVQSSSRWGTVQEMRFGDYRVDSVHVSWGRGGGDGVRLGGIGTEGNRMRQAYRFVLHSPDGQRVAGECASTAQWRDVGIGSVAVNTSARYALDCKLNPGLRDASWTLSLTEERDSGFGGTLALDSVSVEVKTELTGNRMFGRQPSSYELRRDGQTVAAVDPRRRVIWLARAPLEDGARTATVGAAVALLLYRRPTAP